MKTARWFSVLTKTLRWLSVLVFMVMGFASASGAETLHDSDGGVQIVKFVGLIQVTPGTEQGLYVVDDMSVMVGPDTMVITEGAALQVGTKVIVIARKTGDAALDALVVRAIAQPAVPVRVRIKGLVQEIGPDNVVVNGQEIALNQNTGLEGTLALGSFAKVSALASVSGYVALEIEVESDESLQRVEFEGIVTAMVGAVWTVGSHQVQVSGAEIVGNPAVGDEVEVHAHLLADGTIVADRIGLEDVHELDEADSHDGEEDDELDEADSHDDEEDDELDEADSHDDEEEDEEDN